MRKSTRWFRKQTSKRTTRFRSKSSRPWWTRGAILQVYTPWNSDFPLIQLSYLPSKKCKILRFHLDRLLITGIRLRQKSRLQWIKRFAVVWSHNKTPHNSGNSNTRASETLLLICRHSRNLWNTKLPFTVLRTLTMWNFYLRIVTELVKSNICQKQTERTFILRNKLTKERLCF